MKVVVAALGSPSLIVLMVYTELERKSSKLRGCVKVEVAAMKTPPSLIVLMVYTELERKSSKLRGCVKVEVAAMDSPVPNSPYGLH